jgi:hypothetical protein
MESSLHARSSGNLFRPFAGANVLDGLGWRRVAGDDVAGRLADGDFKAHNFTP